MALTDFLTDAQNVKSSMEKNKPNLLAISLIKNCLIQGFPNFCFANPFLRICFFADPIYMRPYFCHPTHNNNNKNTNTQKGWRCSPKKGQHLYCCRDCVTRGPLECLARFFSIFRWSEFPGLFANRGRCSLIDWPGRNHGPPVQSSWTPVWEPLA